MAAVDNRTRPDRFDELFELLVRCHTRDLLNGYSQCPDRPDHRQGARVHPRRWPAGAARGAPPAFAPSRSRHGVGRRQRVLYLARDDARWVTGVVLPIEPAPPPARAVCRSPPRTASQADRSTRERSFRCCFP